MKRSLWRPSLIAMLASAVALPAAAQDAAAPDSQIAEEGDAIREIIVSAQKRDQNLQDVPIAITAFGAEALQERGLADVSAISALTPNVNLDGGTPFSGSSAVLSATIRGIGSDDFAFNIDPGVGIYLDGVFLARTVGANQDLLDVERIEVLKGPQGAMGLLMGNDEDAKKLAATLGNANAVLVRADGLIQRLDSLVVNADRQVFGQDPGGSGNATGGGLVGDARTTVQQLNGLLGEARGSLTKLDTLLVEAQGIASNTREATTDLGALRSDVDASLRKVDALINDLNRKWPFARDTEIKLP